MKTYAKQFTGLIVICISLFLLNLAIIPNYDYVTSTKFTNDNIRPEQNRYWKYRNEDLEKGWEYEFTLQVTDERIIKVANKNVPVLVLEGEGHIEGWPSGVTPHQDNNITVTKQINKENLELITYHLNISYRIYNGDNYTTNYVDEFTTYNYLEFDKPNNISIGTKWTKKILRTQTLEYRTHPDPTEKVTLPSEIINSTVECDRISSVNITAGDFDTYRIVEQQFVNNIRDTTIFRYYSIAVKGTVKTERWNYQSEVVEVEELLEYGLKKPNGENGNGPNNDDSDDNWFETNKNNLMFILIFSIIIIVVAAVMNLSGRKKKN
jgi:hypothetical protein